MQSSETTSKDWLTYIDNEFTKSFDRAPFTMQHTLSAHSLFDLPRLIELSQALPSGSVEYNGANIPVDCDPNNAPNNGLSAADTIASIEQCNSWMVLKNVEQQQPYRKLLQQCLASIAPITEPLVGKMLLPEAFVFISSPNSVTPYHMDPEHNILLQIRGSKTMTLFDRSLVSGEELEHFYQGAHRNMKFQQAYLNHSSTFVLQHGQGLHVPSTMPHFVRNGPEVSISFSITFRTLQLEQKNSVYNLNALLRARGIQPARFGAHPSRDKLKDFTWRALRKVQTTFAGSD